MTPLQECIADCGVNAPLYTVPSDKHPKPMVAVLTMDKKHLRKAPMLAVKVIDLRAGTWYTLEGKSKFDALPDITPVMPKPGDLWETRRGDVIWVDADENGRLWANGDEGADWPIDKWGRAQWYGRDADNSNDLILPYIQPHD